MTTSRKIVIALCAAFVGCGGLLWIEDWNATLRASRVCQEFKVGDSSPEIEQAFKKQKLEARFTSDGHFYCAVISLHWKRDIIIYVFVDRAGRVIRTEFKKRMWI